MAGEEKGTAKERALERLRRHYDMLRKKTEKNKELMLKTERVISEIASGMKRGYRVSVKGRRGVYIVTKTVLSANGNPVIFGVLKTNTTNRREVRLICAERV